MTEGVLKHFVNILKVQGCHTVILYVSRASGEYVSGSDYDLLGIKNGGEYLPLAKHFDGLYMDAFIFPQKDVVGKEQNFLHITGGKVLFEKGSIGTDLLSRVQEILSEPLPPMSKSEIEHHHLWYKKMLSRIEKDDLEGKYRKVWLLMDSLETYFRLRHIHYPGPKKSFTWLKDNDLAAYDLYALALEGSETEHIKNLVAYMWDKSPTPITIF